MRNRLRSGTILFALVAGMGVAAAQDSPGGLRLPGTLAPPTNPSQIQLTPAQKSAIFTAVRDTKIPPPVNKFTVSVGAEVPASIELYTLPVAALSQAPEVKDLRYTMIQSEVVLVDPTKMRIVEVIRPSP